MNKIFFVLMLLIVIGGGAFVAKTHEHQIAVLLRPYKELKPAIRQKTDQLMIDTLGQAEFRKNYELDKTHSSCLDGTGSTGCTVAYRHVLGQKYSDKSVYSVYISARTTEFSGITAEELPNCPKDPNKCIFRIDQQFAQKIARDQKLDQDSLRLIMYEGKVVIEASYCNLESKESRKKIFIDPHDGKILWKGENQQCIGVL